MWFKKKRSSIPESFYEKVVRFWGEFEIRAAEFRSEIDDGNCAELADETTRMVSAMFDGFAWVYGPPPDGMDGHSLTISGEGVVGRQFLADFVLRMAPEIEGWSFHSSRQSGKLNPIASIGIGEVSFKLAGLWVTPSVDEAYKLLDLYVWHPCFPEVSDTQAMTVAYLVLDEVLGEMGTMQWVGEIKISDQHLSEAMPAGELLEYTKAVEVERGWEKFPPTETFTLLQFPKPPGDFFRGDMQTLNTLYYPIVRSFLDGGGVVKEDPLPGSGAEFVFVFFPSDLFDESDAVEFRGVIEDRLAAEFSEMSDGLVIGGSFGTEFSYIDLLIFDGDRSLERISAALRRLGKTPGGGIDFFLEGNKSRRIML